MTNRHFNDFQSQENTNKKLASIESITGEFKQCLRKIIQSAVSNMCGCRTETKAERTNA